MVQVTGPAPGAHFTLIKIAARRNSKALKEAKKNHRKTEPYIHLTFAERRQVLVDLAKIIGDWNAARLFAEAVDKSVVCGSANRPYTPFEFAFRELVQRYEYFLRHRGKAISQDLIGMLVQDNNETMSRRLTEMMRRFHTSGTGWTEIDHIIETALFVDSHLTSMVQMADVCAYATRRFFENKETTLFDLIYPRFDRTNAAVVGIRHFTAHGCSCKVCHDHNLPSASMPFIGESTRF